MGTDKPRISTVAQLAEKLAHSEPGLAEAAVPEHDPAEGPGLVPVHRVSAEATERVAVERKISGPLIGPAAGPVQETSVAAIARVGAPAQA